VLAGLTVLEQAAELAEGIDLRSFALTTRSAIVAYRAHFGAGEPNPVARLEAHLARVGDADRYSKRLILTELAKAHAFRGEAALAAREVRRAEDVALPDGDRRATVKLHLVRALVAGLSLGEEAAAGWLAQAQRLLDPAWDAALDAEVAWYEYLVCPSAFSARSAEALVACARRTGIARAEHLAAASGAAGMTLAAEDRFAATVRAIREPGRGLDEVMAAELLGLLPMCFERSPGQRVYVDASRAVFALEDHGNVTCRELPSAALLTLLRALARGTRSKEDLIREVWNLKVYRPETHDAVVHTAVSRLRTTLEPHAAWIQVSSAGYALASHVELVDLLDTTDAPRSIAASASEASSAPAAVVPDRASRRRLLALEIVQRSGGAATRDVAEALKISDMTAFRVLSALVAEGLIEKVGQGRNTRYVRPPR
jgi:DNA-binding winged helix-turn-helix (wHTH) protein